MRLHRQGWGLQIVRTLVEGDLRGRLDVRECPGGGTVATLRIPVRLGEMGRED